VRRSPSLVVTVLCPHFERPVRATQNAATERLVDCADKEACVEVTTDEEGTSVRVYPSACPVFRRSAT
jgi:hypothetical protein